MKDQSTATASPSIMKMKQARRLMEQGQHQESLLLALDVLLQELNNLRESLIALQLLTRLELKSSDPPVENEPAQPDLFWLPPVKPRVLH